MPAILDPTWPARRYARLAFLARKRRDRRAYLAASFRPFTCSHWKSCHHSYCRKARAATRLQFEAQTLVDALQRRA
jgi:hypothetical protein